MLQMPSLCGCASLPDATSRCQRGTTHPTAPPPPRTLPPLLQGFRTPEEVQRFHVMFDELCHIVATKHSGSLKGEHGTGRNIAPYVEMEWGEWLGLGLAWAGKGGARAVGQAC